MDYFGRAKVGTEEWVDATFQSFWVNGLLWKGLPCLRESVTPESVSILLGQWITLEGRKRPDFGRFLVRFNPSGSMDYFGSF